jgi:hypothetical protein
MNKTVKSFLTGQTFVTLVIVICGWMVYELSPGHYFKAFPLIPLFFYVFGVATIYVFDVVRRYKPNRIFHVYLGVKVVKMLLAILILGLYIIGIGRQKVEFGLTLMGCYMMHMVYETIYFCSFEMGLKKRLQEKKRKNEL